ncbi:MAG: hypothetical protein AUJ04_04080 [Acidobacteria bacterium 13_1_40CM_3_55_6]|nr:MAG: hypothetical protein AUJ04_04080 [Acidobacteria bacterium 13_1_40CM_3_55_6]
MLDELERAKRQFDVPESQVISTLSFFARRKIENAKSLIRLHETLLFLRAYPQGASVLSQVEKTLRTLARVVPKLRDKDLDLSPLDNPEVSGIAGTRVTSNFSYVIVCWLVAKYPKQLSIDWDWFEEEDRFGATMPRFMPLLEEEAMVEAHVPYRDWLRAARRRENEVAWLIGQFESMNVSENVKSELYDSLKLHLTWRFGFRSSRTGMKLPVSKVFFHNQPLIQRRDISLSVELLSPPIPIEEVSRALGAKILDIARETSAVRYRELHGFTYGDSRRVLKASLGRGTEAFVIGVPPEHRLPLRAYHAALIFKNGVPVAYFEGLSLFERMESGFNLYYTFRDGETAWLYARILRLMRQLLGVTVFSIEPYQIGHENEEGIESGAFWFYRKLGFRPVRPELMKLTLSEEQKIAARRDYRTSARTLRRLAGGHLLFELEGSGSYACDLPLPLGEGRGEGAKRRDQKERGGGLPLSLIPHPSPLPKGEGVSEWDDFAVRNLGLAVQRRMAKDFSGEAPKIRDASVKFVKRALGLRTDRWREAELNGLENLALVLAMIPGVERWSADKKESAAQIIRAKANSNEARYLRLMQRHTKLRAGIIALGS